MYDSPIEKDKKPMYESTTDKINAQDNLINTDSFLSGNKKNESIKSFDNKNLKIEFSAISGRKESNNTQHKNNVINCDNGPPSSISEIVPIGGNGNKYNFTPEDILEDNKRLLEKLSSKSIKFTSKFVAPIKINNQNNIGIDLNVFNSQKEIIIHEDCSFGGDRDDGKKILTAKTARNGTNPILINNEGKDERLDKKDGSMMKFAYLYNLIILTFISFL